MFRQGKSLARHSRTTALKPMHLPIEIPFEFIPPPPISGEKNIASRTIAYANGKWESKP